MDVDWYISERIEQIDSHLTSHDRYPGRADSAIVSVDVRAEPGDGALRAERAAADDIRDVTGDVVRRPNRPPEG